ncbi:putative ankyrin repeat protein PAE1861 [Aspergillus udagawae]|nr:putative ankyrin repeat protein PAE1861 [Aspergillus udagawae]
MGLTGKYTLPRPIVIEGVRLEGTIPWTVRWDFDPTNDKQVHVNGQWGKGADRPKVAYKFPASQGLEADKKAMEQSVVALTKAGKLKSYKERTLEENDRGDVVFKDGGNVDSAVKAVVQQWTALIQIHCVGLWLSAGIQNIRIISCDDGSTFVQVDDHLKHLSHHPLDDEELALVTDAIHPSRIEQAIVLSGSHRAAFLCDKGQLYILVTQDGNDQPTTRVNSIPGKEISHIAVRSARMHNPALISGAVALVLESDSRTVVSFDSWQPMIAWLTDNETKEAPTHSATFAAPIVKLTSKFAALDEAGTVHVWGVKSTVQPPDPPDEDEAFEEAWNRYVLFGDPIQQWPSRRPEALDYTPRSLPLPPIKKLATGGCYNAGISRAGQLFIWGYRSGKWPEIADVNPMSAAEFKEAVIRTDTGNRLQIVDSAAGRAHVIALGVDGSLWSAGDGLNGQLGIGTRQFGLCTGDGNTDIAANDTGEEFAVHWQKMDTAGILGNGERCEAVFCEGDHTLIVARNNTV